jgi:hypothetical protein
MSAARAPRSVSAAGFYHCSVKGVGRSAGRSIVAAAAYRSGERLADERTGETFDYRARGGVLDKFIIVREDASTWANDRAQLWNGAERTEPRANARMATELELALPCELTAAQRRELVTEFVRGIVERHGVAADVSIHAPGKEGDHRNNHAHVLLTHRELGAVGFGEIANTRTQTRKRKGKDGQHRLEVEKIAGIAATPGDVTAIRQAWEREVNRAYERAGLDIRVDHRSHEDRGIGEEPTKHLGPTAAAMDRRGAESDRGAVNHDIAQRNAAHRKLAALEAEAAAIKTQIIDLQAARENREGSKEGIPTYPTLSENEPAATTTRQILAGEPETAKTPAQATTDVGQRIAHAAGADQRNSALGLPAAAPATVSSPGRRSPMPEPANQNTPDPAAIAYFELCTAALRQHADAGKTATRQGLPGWPKAMELPQPMNAAERQGLEEWRMAAQEHLGFQPKIVFAPPREVSTAEVMQDRFATAARDTTKGLEAVEPTRPQGSVPLVPPAAPERGPEREPEAAERPPAREPPKLTVVFSRGPEIGPGAPETDFLPPGTILDRLLESLARTVEMVLDTVFGFFVAEPKLTAQQAHDLAQAAGNVETSHAQAVAGHAAEIEAARDEQIAAHDQDAQNRFIEQYSRYGVIQPVDRPQERGQERGPEIERDY